MAPTNSGGEAGQPQGKTVAITQATNGSLVEKVREEIENMILQGDLASGAKVNESVIAAKLQVSRGPVREALQALVSRGVVRSVRNQGVFVREVSLEEALDLYDIRAGLAHTAGGLLAARVSKEQINALNQLWDEMDNACAQADHHEYHRINLVFHERLLEYAGNPRLEEISGIVQKELTLFMRRGVLGPLRLSVSNKEHREIIDAIVSGDSDAAGRACEIHILHGKHRMLDSLTHRRRD